MANMYIMTRHDSEGREWYPMPFTGAGKALAYVADADPADLTVRYNLTENMTQPAPLTRDESYDFRAISLKLMNGFIITGFVGDLAFKIYKTQVNAVAGTSQKVY